MIDSGFPFKHDRVISGPLLVRSAVVVTLLAAAFGSVHAGSQGTDGAPLSHTGRRNISDMRAVVKQTARQHIETSASAAMPGRTDVTSRDRRTRLLSAAHDRGAVDFGVKRSPNPAMDAAAIARRVGPNHTTIYEQPKRGGDIHTSFKQPRQGADLTVNRYTVPARADGPHIHVQPNYYIRTDKEVASRYKARENATIKRARMNELAR